MPPKRHKGVTFKLVHKSYEDEDYDETANAIMVEEREVRRHLPSAVGGNRRRRQREEDCMDDAATMSDWANDWESTATGTSSHRPQMRLPNEENYMNRRNTLLAQDCGADRNKEEEECVTEEEEEEEKLFEDQEEVEFADDFLQEIVFGEGEADEDEAEAYDGDGDAEDEGLGASYDESVYAQHDVTRRGVDRQFTQMMREFNVDARLNEAYTDDPRAHGAMDVHQYLRALEEFVVDKAGINYNTSEPLRNKGLIQQLKSMASHAGTAMSANGEVYTTTLLPDKHARFAEEFQRESELIRRAAQQRIYTKQEENVAQQQKEQAAKAQSPEDEPKREEEEEEEESDVKEVYVETDMKVKANRMDCETVVSAYSTYYNQPNVIKAPNPIRRLKRQTKAYPSPSNQIGVELAKRNETDEIRNENEFGNDESEDEAPHLEPEMFALARSKDETKEEKKMRQQLAKQMQRERRNKKKELKNMYKTLEVDELKRTKESQNAKKTVHFF